MLSAMDFIIILSLQCLDFKLKLQNLKISLFYINISNLLCSSQTEFQTKNRHSRSHADFLTVPINFNRILLIRQSSHFEGIQHRCPLLSGQLVVNLTGFMNTGLAVSHGRRSIEHKP